MAACSHPRARASSKAELPGAPLALGAEPRLSLGVVRGDTAEMFDRIVTPFLLSDGRLVVPDAGEHTIRVFGPDGQLEEGLGREGSGPGEFSRLTDAWAHGDTIEAFDWNLERITRFLPGGQPDVVILDGGAQPQLALPGPFGSGWVLAAIAHAGFGHRDDWVLEEYGRNGAFVRDITHVPGMLRYRLSTMTGPAPLSPRQAFTIHADRLYTGETLTPKLDVWKPDGTLERTITWQPVPSLSPSAALNEVLDSVAARSGPAGGAAARKRWESAPVPNHLSVFWDVLVDPDGFVWIRPYRPIEDAAALSSLAGTGPGGTWLIVAPQGGVVDSLTVPANLRPTQITDDAVVGIRRDSLGVESVAVYPLTRRPG